MNRTEPDGFRGGVVLFLGFFALLTALIPFGGFVYTWPLALLGIWFSVPALRLWRSNQIRPHITLLTGFGLGVVAALLDAVLWIMVVWQ